MPKYLIFNHIHSDGLGDFTHFEDIMKVLLVNPRFKHIEFIAFVRFNSEGKKSNYDRVCEKVKALGIEVYLGDEHYHEKLKQDKRVQKLLSTVDEVVSISCYESLHYFYQEFLKPGICHKDIRDHEIGDLDSTPNNLSRAMGLSVHGEHYGIKIADVERLTHSEASEIIVKNDPDFAEVLLQVSNCKSMQEFDEKNYIVPAYHSADRFFAFILFLMATNNTFPKDKNIVLYHSGSDLSEFAKEEAAELSKALADSHYTKIVIHRSNGHEPLVIEGNARVSSVLNILSGFYVSDKSFNAMYQLAPFASVSGDNTFERCVANEILPWYWSTNMLMKCSTGFAIAEIAQLPELDLSKEARAAFHDLFDASPGGLTNVTLKNLWKITTNQVPQVIKTFQTVNFEVMIKEWPVIARFLKVNRNFYDNLAGIILEKPGLLSQARTGLFNLFHKKQSIDYVPACIRNKDRHNVFPATGVKHKL